MELYLYLLTVRLARSDVEWAHLRLQELDAGVPLPSMDFGPHGRGGTHADMTAIEAISRIRRREFCIKKLEDAMKVLNEFKGIINKEQSQ